jgi:predicted transposase YdaD
MSKTNPKSKRRHQDFDKTLKETFRRVIPTLLEKVCGIKVPRYTFYTPQLTRTKERRPDFALLAETENGEDKYILHLEFQSQNDVQMDKRELEYYEMLFHETGLEVKQYVVYLGIDKPTMSTTIVHENLQFRYNLVDLKTIDAQVFLQSDQPEELILAILAKYPRAKAGQVIDIILTQLKKIVKSKRNLEKYCTQLDILSRLRKLQPLTKKRIDKMPIIIDLESDVAYQRAEKRGEKRGEKIGETKGLEKAVQIVRFLEEKVLNESEIAKKLRVPVKYVRTIKAQLDKQTQAIQN